MQCRLSLHCRPAGRKGSHVAQERRPPRDAGGSKAKLIVLAFLGLGTLAIIALAVNLWLRKPAIVVKVENPRKIIENLKRKARSLHRAKEFDEAIKTYDELTAYCNKLRKEDKYQGEGFEYIDEFASMAQAQRKQAEDDRLASSPGGILAKTQEGRLKLIAEGRSHKTETVIDAALYAGYAEEDYKFALEYIEEARKFKKEAIKREALQKARKSVNMYGKIRKQFPEDIDKYKAAEQASRDLVAKLESELGEKKDP